jgi:hypothetical protein
VSVVITTEPDKRTWHALHCPRRAMVLGPLSTHHLYELQKRFELVRDENGVRHLRRTTIEPSSDGPPRAACCRAVPGDSLPFHTAFYSDGRIGYEDVEGTDLYADWERGDVCRECLVSQLPHVEEDPP